MSLYLNFKTVEESLFKDILIFNDFEPLNTYVEEAIKRHLRQLGNHVRHQLIMAAITNNADKASIEQIIEQIAQKLGVDLNN